MFSLQRSVCRNIHTSSTAAKQLVLYDVPSSNPCQAWSPNAWKIRLLLNYKDLNYRTKWTELPNLQSELADHVTPNVLGALYSAPAVQFEDGRILMGSERIAEEICTRWPDPTVNLHSPTRTLLEQLLPEIYRTIAGVYIPLVPQRLLTDASRDYWHKTRETRFGMPLERLQAITDLEKAWEHAKPNLEKVTKMLQLTDREGPLFHGVKISYADFIWAGFLIYMKRIGADVFDRLLKTTGDERVHYNLLQALSPWSERKTW